MHFLHVSLQNCDIPIPLILLILICIIYTFFLGEPSQFFFLIKLETYDLKIGKFPKYWVLLQFEGDFFLFFNLMIMKLYSNYRFFFICITILLLFFQTLFLVCLCKKIVYMYFLLLFFQTVFLIFGMSL